MEDKTKIHLTSAEISGLWNQYLSDTATVCVVSHMLKHVEDEELRPVVEHALSASKSNISFIEDFFRSENYPIPIGFNDRDVNLNTPKLFSDTFVAIYLRNMSVLGMAASSVALGVVTRADVVHFHKHVLKSAIDLQDLTREHMLSNGTYIRPPIIPIPKKVDLVDKQQFLSGFIGKQRPLTTIEITHLFQFKLMLSERQ